MPIPQAELPRQRLRFPGVRSLRYILGGWSCGYERWLDRRIWTLFLHRHHELWWRDVKASKPQHRIQHNLHFSDTFVCSFNVMSTIVQIRQKRWSRVNCVSIKLFTALGHVKTPEIKQTAQLLLGASYSALSKKALMLSVEPEEFDRTFIQTVQRSTRTNAVNFQRSLNWREPSWPCPSRPN
jgi:hypothetical protein